MLEASVVFIFITLILISVISGHSIIYALLIGLILFFAYSIGIGYRASETLKMIVSGISKIKVMLISFMLIGILSALWRASGTIAVIVCLTSDYITPMSFVVTTWLLCSIVSFLLGSSFGTAATMGVVCMMMAKAIGADVALSGGAILGGCYFGDRCSPVSPSALVKSQLTGTDIYKNIPLMLKSNFVPFLISTILYVVLGKNSYHSETLPNIKALFSSEFQIDTVAIVPALLILVLAAFHMNARRIMLISSIVSAFIAILIQGISIPELIRTMIFGYFSNKEELSNIVNGGGVVSMIRAMCILIISSGQAGIFKGIGMFSDAQKAVDTIKEKYTPFTAVLITSVITSLIFCTETPAIFIILQICDFKEIDKYDYVMMIEDTVAYIAALVPWGLLASVPLATIGASNTSILYAFNLYLLPLCSLATSFIRKKRA